MKRFKATSSFLTATIIGLVWVMGTSQKATAVGVQTFNLPVSSTWFDTGIDVGVGNVINITASGTITFGFSSGQYADANGVGPLYDGTTLDSAAALPNTIVLSLIGKIGGTTALGTGTLLSEGVPGKGEGFVGSLYSQIANSNGRLYLGYNDELINYSDNSGTFAVTVTVVPEPSAAGLFGLTVVGLFIKRLIPKS